MLLRNDTLGFAVDSSKTIKMNKTAATTTTKIAVGRDKTLIYIMITNNDNLINLQYLYF